MITGEKANMLAGFDMILTTVLAKIYETNFGVMTGKFGKTSKSLKIL